MGIKSISSTAHWNGPHKQSQTHGQGKHTYGELQRGIIWGVAPAHHFSVSEVACRVLLLRRSYILFRVTLRLQGLFIGLSGDVSMIRWAAVFTAVFLFVLLNYSFFYYYSCSQPPVWGFIFQLATTCYALQFKAVKLEYAPLLLSFFFLLNA